jgi:hypothetical protein
MERRLSLGEIALALSVDSRAVSLLVRRERLPAERRDGRLHFDPLEVDAWTRRRHGRDLVLVDGSPPAPTR